MDTPSTARIIDYWLGGAHHHPVDVAAADALTGVYPAAPAVFVDLRRFIGRAVGRLHALGIRHYLVFGAGIPSQGNVHEHAPDSRVLYLDIDAENIALGRQVLGDDPLVTYTFGDLTDPAAVTRPDWGDAPVGVAVFGLPVFFADDVLAAALEGLHAATPAGSHLAFDFDSRILADHPQVLAIMGEPFHMREPAEFEALLGPWTVTADGIGPVAGWGLGPGERPADVPTNFYGGLARHR